MRTASTVGDVREHVANARKEGVSIGLVPTMGAFHEGHLSLMRRARAECGFVVVSLFVNPTQFGDGEDLDTYPRDPDRDAALAGEAGVDLLFAPPFEEIYPQGFSSTIEVGRLGEVLCGGLESRGPGHFRGVATVVTKLLNICQPDVAYFGAKDFQQALVIKRVVRDLDIPVRIELCPTVRDRDGLAMSSRNAYLSPADRERALSLKRSLDAAERAVTLGATRAEEIAEATRKELEAAGVEPEYVEVVSARDLTPLEDTAGEEVLVAVAARVGSARLIDNVVVKPESLNRNAEEAHSGSMQRQMLKSKIHRATVTDCDLHYAGSITVDSDLMREADLLPNELVHVLDVDSGQRFETYVIEGSAGSGEVQVNGAAARLVHRGDRVIILAYGLYPEAELGEYKPRVVHVDAHNQVVRVDADPAAVA